MLLAIIIITTALIIFALTRRISIIIKKDERWRVLVRLPIGPLVLKKTVAGGSRTKKKEKQSGRSSLHHYREIYRRFLRIFAYSEVEIRRLSLPCEDSGEHPSKDATRPWKYHSVLLSLLTLLKSNARKLVIDDNAVILNSDTNRLTVDITVKVRLFHIIGTLTVFLFSEKFLKKRKKAA